MGASFQHANATQSQEVIRTTLLANEDTSHVAWATSTSLTRNPRFVRELESKVGKDKKILLLCRSGKRSALAVEAAKKAGFTDIHNVKEGFEGEIDDRQHRGTADGWRFHQLPWVQS